MQMLGKYAATYNNFLGETRSQTRTLAAEFLDYVQFEVAVSLGIVHSSTRYSRVSAHGFFVRVFLLFEISSRSCLVMFGSKHMFRYMIQNHIRLYEFLVQS